MSVFAPRSFSAATRDRLPYRSSSDSNSFMSEAAVFGPTPGTPGMLSQVSPVNARKSAKRSGATP